MNEISKPTLASSDYLNQETRRAVDVLRERLEKFPPMFKASDTLAYIELLKLWAVEMENEAINHCLRVANGLIDQKTIRKSLTEAISFQVTDAVWDMEQAAKEELQAEDDMIEARHQRELGARWSE